MQRRYKEDTQRKQTKHSGGDLVPDSNRSRGHQHSTLSLITWHVLCHSAEFTFLLKHIQMGLSLGTQNILITKIFLFPTLQFKVIIP